MGIQLETGGGKKSVRPVINVTPLVDVVLVLLIIFMVVIPNMQEHKTIELFPTTKAEEDAEDERSAAIVTLAFDGSHHLGKQVMSRPQLIDELRRIEAEEPDRKIMVRADKRLPYGTVRSFFYEIKEIGHENVKLAVGSVTEADLGLDGLSAAPGES